MHAEVWPKANTVPHNHQQQIIFLKLLVSTLCHTAQTSRAHLVPGECAALLWPGIAGGAARQAGSFSPLQKVVLEHMAMAPWARRVQAQAASCRVSWSRDGDGTHPVRACGWIPHMYHKGRACFETVAACLAYLTETCPDCPGRWKRPFFFPVSKCPFTLPTEAGWAKTKEQPEARF